jgi:hypothetical protein
MANVFNIAKLQIMDGTIDLETDNIDCLLLTLGPASPLSDGQYDLTSVADVVADAGFTEASDATYETTTNGRRNVVVTTSTKNDTTNISEAKFTADGNGGIATWEAVDNETYQGLLIYKRAVALGSANDATTVAIAYCELSSDVTANGGDVTITFSDNIFLTFGN